MISGVFLGHFVVYDYILWASEREVRRGGGIEIFSSPARREERMTVWLGCGLRQRDDGERKGSNWGRDNTDSAVLCSLGGGVGLGLGKHGGAYLRRNICQLGRDAGEETSLAVSGSQKLES